MNRANVIGPSRAISAWIRATRSASSPTASRSGCGVAPQARRGVHHVRPPGRPPMTSRTPGPTSVWPPSRIGIGAAAADVVSSAQPRIGDRARRAAGPMRSGPRRRASGSRRRRAGGRGAPGCRRSPRRDSCARWLPSDPGPSRSISAPRTEAGGRWPATLRPQAALFDQRAGPRRRRALQPGERGRGRSAGDEELGRRVARHGADGRQAFAHTGRVDGGGPVAGRSDPAAPPIRTRSSGPSMSMPSRHRRRRSRTV